MVPGKPLRVNGGTDRLKATGIPLGVMRKRRGLDGAKWGKYMNGICAAALSATLGLAIPTTAFAQDDGEVVVKQFEGGGRLRGHLPQWPPARSGRLSHPRMDMNYSGEWADGVIAGEGTARFRRWLGL